MPAGHAADRVHAAVTRERHHRRVMREAAAALAAGQEPPSTATAPGALTPARPPAAAPPVAGVGALLRVELDGTGMAVAHFDAGVDTIVRVVVPVDALHTGDAHAAGALAATRLAGRG